MSRSTEEQDLAKSGGGPEGLPKRWSAKRKAEVVLRLLRGEDIGVTEETSWIDLPGHRWRELRSRQGNLNRRRAASTSLIHQLRLSEPLKKVGALGGGRKQRMERSGAGCGPGDAPRM